MAALLYGFRATGEPVPHPMNATDGNMMWDALGGGCIDGGSWDEPYPAGKSDVRSPAFCIPQPCVRLLSQEELEREVLGRRLEEGEYATYLDRLEETCGELPPASAADDPGYLQLASLGWTEVLSTSGYGPIEAPGLLGQFAVPAAPAPSLLWVRPPVRPDQGGFVPRGPSGGPSFGGGGSGGRPKPDSSDGKSTQTPDRTPKPEIVTPPSKFDPKPKPDPDTPTTPDPLPEPETPDPNLPQPSPVPLPAGLPMLLTALAAAFALRRR